MAINAHFRTFGKLDGIRPQEGTVTINRHTGLFTVRPLRKWKVYSLPLSYVAEMVVWHVIREEIRERKRAKKKGKS